ncbi:hypothetical protein ES288_A10G231400v1 [Gossypium darwinii]|uniref:SB domain-containing protein n=1 Tax=Gossypium darwinii TaxID=34276 RepID=A0A5D2F323_GOSDA|nr:hypothetical protein ES288_A10G231400v1 [Gossypium darwinii]
MVDPPTPPFPHLPLPFPPTQNRHFYPQRWPLRQPPPSRRYHPHALPRRHLQHPHHNLAHRILPSLPSRCLRESHARHDHQTPPSPRFSLGQQQPPPPRVAAAGYPPSPYGRAQPSQTEDAAEVYKRNAVNKLVEVVHGDIIKMRKEREAEMEGLFSAQGVLRKREEEVNKGLKEMQDEKEALEQQLQVVLMSTDVLAGWVRENEGKIKNLGKNNDSVDVDVDEVFHCADVLSKQMLDCTAADLAIEDVVYSLDKALQEGAVPFDQYLRNVRLLSREQFFHKATAAKVRAAQMQAQVASMAARAPHSHYAP